MEDRVAEVLAQRATLERGAGTAIAISLFLHAAITAAAVYAATHAKPPERVAPLNIQFASMPRAASSAARAPISTPAAATPTPPAIEPPKPVIEEPKPQTTPSKTPPEKNTVPFSSFGRSTKKGSETPATAPPRAPAASSGVGTMPEVPVGGAGVTGLEGGDFPYTLYIEGMQRRIGGNWFRPQVAGGATVVVYFRILRDGTIDAPRIETPSGNSTFDRAALSAVRSSNPLTPLPFAYTGEYLGVHLTFR